MRKLFLLALLFAGTQMLMANETGTVQPKSEPAEAQVQTAGEPVSQEEHWAAIQMQLIPQIAIHCSATPLYGFNLAAIGETRYGEGMSLHIYQESGEFYGFQLGGISTAETSGGLQLSVFNSASTNEGWQMGLVNVSGELAIAEKEVKESGVQIGGFNYADSGFQIGFINYNKNSAIFPWMILVNWSCD